MSLDHYIRHAQRFGGFDTIWDTAASDLTPTELANLAHALRQIKRPNGERFTRRTDTIIRRIRQERQDAAKTADFAQQPRAITRNENPDAMDSPPTCEWCGKPLPTTARADTRFCIGGACKQASYRARTPTTKGTR